MEQKIKEILDKSNLDIKSNKILLEHINKYAFEEVQGKMGYDGYCLTESELFKISITTDGKISGFKKMKLLGKCDCTVTYLSGGTEYTLSIASGRDVFSLSGLHKDDCLRWLDNLM